jgi:hypothetical protein
MALNDVEFDVDTQEVMPTELFDLDLATGIPYSLEPSAPIDEEQILDAEDVAAELMPDMPSAPPPRRSGIAAILPPSAAGAERARRVTLTESFLPSMAADPFASFLPPPSAAANSNPSSELSAAQAEIARLQRQMRARDAYLAEIERALDASTRQLEAAGLSSVDDALRLLGRVRGQAFRIAELESELRQQARGPEPSSLAAARKAKTGAGPGRGKPRAARAR